MYFIRLERGDFFIRAMAEKQEIYFIMDNDGNHVTDQMEFHHKSFYEKSMARNRKERPVPPPYDKMAQKIVDKYLNGDDEEKELLIRHIR